MFLDSIVHKRIKIELSNKETAFRNCIDQFPFYFKPTRLLWNKVFRELGMVRSWYKSHGDAWSSPWVVFFGGN